MKTNKEIKDWLKNIKKDRPWLAEQCGVSLSTVNNWLATGPKTNPIPERKMQLITKLMAATTNRENTLQKAETKDNSEWRAVALMLSKKDHRDLVMIANGRPIDQVMRDILLEKMREILKDES